MNEQEKRTVTSAIIEFLDWTYEDRKDTTEFEAGIRFGLKIAQQIAEEVERNA